MFTIKRFESFEDIKTEWQDLEKLVNHYPFQVFWYQKLFAEQFCNAEDVYLLGAYDNGTLLAIGGFEKVGNKILFLGMKQVLGGQDVTDYGDLLFAKDVTEQQASEVWEAIIAYFSEFGIKELQLDFVREDSVTYHVIASDKEAISWDTTQTIHNGIAAPVRRLVRNDVTKQEVAPYLIVPSSRDEYLQLLGRKERHELKRKIKRFEEQQAFHFCSHETIEKDFDEFIRLHRLSDLAKEQFMSDEMKEFFWKVVCADKTDYRIDFCFLEIEGKRVASIMSFIGEGKALLYNSGFDPEYAYYSVGLILHAYLIKKSIEEKLHIHDFLRGNERYKYDLGAKDMQLYKILIPLTPFSSTNA